jgi:hypothetical protein
MKTENTLYVLSGPPRCGKSTWAREKASQLAAKGMGCPIVSGDGIRRAVYQRRFWMPGENLIRPYAWVMVRALFVAGHQDVIIDETNLDEEAIGFWACNYKAITASRGGSDYPALLEVDEIEHKIAKSPRKVAYELQGDIIAWRRHVVVFRTSFRECEKRAKKLNNYNQRSELIKHIRWLEKVKKWNADFITSYKFADGERVQFVS